jgi:hypothetical protein
MLKRIFICIGLATVASGCLEQSSRKPTAGPIYRHHFAGTLAVSKSTNAVKLNEIGALPASRELREQIVQKLARAPRLAWQKQLSGNAPDQADLFRPLIDDLIQQESYVEVRDRSRKLDAVIAVKLADERARLWQTNVTKALDGWQQGARTDVAVGTSKGWQLKRKQAPNMIQFFRAGQWVVLGIGQDDLALTAAALEQISKTGQPVPSLTNDWLELTVDLPTFKNRFPALAKQELPQARLTVGGLGGAMRTEGRFTYPGRIDWKYEPWKIPMKTVTEPLVSFTVARGIAPILKNSPSFRDLKLKEVPNQFCLWGQQHEYSLSFMAVPVSDATNLVSDLAPTLPKVAQEAMPGHFGNFFWVSNRAEIIWQGLPFVVPRLQAIREGGADYVFAGLFPKWPNTNPPPAELLSKFMNRSNLVYYDWEITPERIKHANQLLQLYNIANDLNVPGTNVPTQAWLQTVGAHLGNTVTEMSITAPDELSLVRRSNIGLTGFELAALMRWVESPGFPLRYDRPPTMRKSRGTNTVRSGMPAPGAARTNTARTNAAKTTVGRGVPAEPLPPRK